MNIKNSCVLPHKNIKFRWVAKQAATGLYMHMPPITILNHASTGTLCNITFIDKFSKKKLQVQKKLYAACFAEI
jgi:hypothetical protein